MIKYLQLNNFKSHKETGLNLSNLTILCGSNGVGKSSAIQALLLLRESYLGKSEFNYLDLKSNPINLGTAKDAIYQFAGENKIGIRITTDLNNLSYEFGIRGNDFSKTLLYKPEEVTHITDKELLEKENLFDNNCQFISAARLGPQPYYVKDDVIVEIYNQISVIEGRAEHFVHFLMVNQAKEVLKLLRNENQPDVPDLHSQTNAWEREISSGVNVIAEDIGNLGYELKYQFSTESQEGKTYQFKSVNVGFGLSYVMPIIVAILSAPPGALIIIENPEAHIHPRGQAKIAELICLAAQAGIQLIIETHSDHIINGILVQCKKFEETGKGIDKKNAFIYHFDRNEAEHCSIPNEIRIEQGGKIRYTPQGFFDQFTIDRRFLMDF